MASALTHGVLAATLVQVWPSARRIKGVYPVAILLSILPDADVIAFAFGIPYSHLLGHRGISHSILFAATLGLLASFWLLKRETSPQIPVKSLAACLFLVTASHGFLDALTDGGLGIAFLAPVDQTRYFFPWRPLVVSPIGISAFFSRWGARVIGSEFFWVWIPCLAVLSLSFYLRRPSTGAR